MIDTNERYLLEIVEKMNARIEEIKICLSEIMCFLIHNHIKEFGFCSICGSILKHRENPSSICEKCEEKASKISFKPQ